VIGGMAAREIQNVKDKGKKKKKKKVGGDQWQRSTPFDQPISSFPENHLPVESSSPLFPYRLPSSSSLNFLNFWKVPSWFSVGEG